MPAVSPHFSWVFTARAAADLSGLAPLAFWHLDWPHIYSSEEHVRPIREAAARWSDRIIAISGLLNEVPR